MWRTDIPEFPCRKCVVVFSQTKNSDGKYNFNEWNLETTIGEWVPPTKGEGEGTYYDSKDEHMWWDDNADAPLDKDQIYAWYYLCEVTR